jgi:hypothetical protein
MDVSRFRVYFQKGFHTTRETTVGVGLDEKVNAATDGSGTLTLQVANWIIHSNARVADGGRCHCA